MQAKVSFLIGCLLSVSLGCLHAQGYGILADAICWNNGVDSSIVRLILASSSNNEPGFVRYVNQAGNPVDVSAGGSFSYGYCCCGGGGGSGGNVTRAFQIADLRGLFVQTVGGVDSVGIDIPNIPINLAPTATSAYVVVWDSLTNANVRTPLSSIDTGGSTTTADNGLTNSGTPTAANIQLGGTLIQNTTIQTDGFFNRWRGLNSAGSAAMTLLQIQNPSVTGFGITMNGGKQAFSDLGGYMSSSIAAGGVSMFVEDGNGFLVQADSTAAGKLIEQRQTNQSWYVRSGLSADINNPDIELLLNPEGINLRADINGTEKAILIQNGYIRAIGIPNYANDAAATADALLPSGGVYTVTAENRSLRIKP